MPLPQRGITGTAPLGPHGAIWVREVGGGEAERRAQGGARLTRKDRALLLELKRGVVETGAPKFTGSLLVTLCSVPIVKMQRLALPSLQNAHSLARLWIRQ